jgi:hypothetical protein
VKNIFFVICIICVSLSSCSVKYYQKIYKKTMSVNDAIAEKEKLDNATNPADRYLLKRDLKKRFVEIEDIVVKDVTQSANIDYPFTVIVEVEHTKGVVECYIYSHDVETIAMLKKGESHIHVLGYFSRFFTLLDDTYAKIEILESDITVLK